MSRTQAIILSDYNNFANIYTAYLKVLTGFICSSELVFFIVIV